MFIDNFVFNLKSIYLNPVLAIVITLFLLFNAITDYKKHLIYNKSNLALLISRIILGVGIIPYSLILNKENIYGLLLGWLIILIPAVVFYFCAGGDIKLMAVIGFYLGIHVMIVFSFISIFLYLIYRIFLCFRKKSIDKKEEIPFAPFTLNANIILLILSFLI